MLQGTSVDLEVAAATINLGGPNVSDHVLDEQDDHEGRKGDETVALPLWGLGAVFVRARKASNLTERGLAKRVGVNESRIRCWEADGYSSATLDQAQQVADRLGVGLSVTAYGDGVRA